MVPIHLMLLLVATFHHTTAKNITDGTELVFASLVYRHGDRSPILETLATLGKSIDLDLAEEKAAKYGYGELTERGKKRAYELGQFLRSRYDSLLSETYDPSEIYVRASNSTRTMETLRFQLAGLYPSESVISNNTVVQQPVPEDVINDPFLPLSFHSICQPFLRYLSNSLYSSCSSILAEYPDLLEKVTTLTGVNVTARPLLTYLMHDSYLALQNIGYELEPEIKAVLPELRNAAGDAIDVILGQPEYWPLESGVLLDDFFETSAKISDEISTQKMHVYSAHDINVYALQMASQVSNRHWVPAYCSVFGWELRRVVKTGKLVVLPYYLPYPGEPVMYLRVHGCGGYLCDLDTFKGITQGYSITEEEFDGQCQGNTTSSK